MKKKIFGKNYFPLLALKRLGASKSGRTEVPAHSRRHLNVPRIIVHTKKVTVRWHLGLRPQTSVCDTLIPCNCTLGARDVLSFTQRESRSSHFNFGFKPSLSSAKSQLQENTRATDSHLSLNAIFVPQKVPYSKSFDDVIACDLRFGPIQSKILATPTRPSWPTPAKSERFSLAVINKLCCY